MLTFAFVGIGVGEALSLACFAPKQTPKIGSHLVLSTILHSMALGTLLDKGLLSLFNVCRHVYCEHKYVRYRLHNLLT